jgi:ubiquinone/menaquinone biosynthesis C-methylase UbiE
MILIVYTTSYRKGSDMFRIASETLRKELKQQGNNEVVCRGILGKKDLVELFHTIQKELKTIDELHFIGHSGMYGPMYGTVNYPEQFSPYELRTLQIPFSNNAKAYFHCCRSARWFAPYFAEQFNVETFGYHWYTAFSTDRTKFKKANSSSKQIFAVGCPGKKSHGIVASIRKYSGTMTLEKMKSFKGDEIEKDSSYNKVAHLYAEAFKDIKVRHDEWHWLNKHLPKDKNIKVLDLGCGNGSLLKELSPSISSGIGIDASESIINYAIKLNESNSNIEFKVINEPVLPVHDQSIDVVISMLSFRYLDWDPIMNEIKRVLKPGGKVLIIDMVNIPVKWHEIHLFLYDKIINYIQRIKNPEFYNELKKLVTSPDWANMLKYNPIRSEHEMKWYLESRFPGKKIEKINIGYNSCIIAFDSGNIENISNINLSYP